MAAPRLPTSNTTASLLARARQVLARWQRCPACDARGGPLLCPRCLHQSAAGPRASLATTGEIPLHFVGAYRAAADGRSLSPLGRSLVAFKDRGDRRAGRALAALFAESCGPLARYADAVVPVPPEPSRLRVRGHAPASWLAGALARRCRVPLELHLLRRRAGHAAQRGLDGAARRENVRGAFTVSRASGRGLSVVLVDDVVTSGATLHEAAACLETAGVQVAFAAVLACADEGILRACRSRTARAGTRSTGEPPLRAR